MYYYQQILSIMQTSFSTNISLSSSMLNLGDQTSKLNNQKSVVLKALLDSALEHHKNGKFKQAIDGYQKALEIKPKNSGAFYNIGSIYTKMKLFQKSINYFQKAIELKPNFIEAHIYLGLNYQKIKERELSQKCYLKAIEIDRKNNKALHNLYLLYMQYNQTEKAEKILNRMLTDNPKSQVALNGLGIIQKKRKNNNKAVQYWEKILQINSNFVESCYNISLIKISQGKFQQAQLLLNKANILRRDDLLILSITAINAHKSNKIDEAFQILDRIKVIMGSASLQELEISTNIKKNALVWIKQTIEDLSKIQQLNKQKSRMSADQRKSLKYLNDACFNSFIEVDQGEQHQQKILKIKQKIEQLSLQLKLQNNRIDKIEMDVQKIKIDIDRLKKQLQWDLKFDQLLEEQPENATYYRSLYSIICTSVQTYRTLATGLVSNGDNMIKSKAGGFIDKIIKILHLGEFIPTVSHFCSILTKIGQFYLQKQSQHVRNQILGVTSQLYNDKKLTKATSEAIIFLSKQSLFQKLLKGDKKDDKIWYQNVIQKIMSSKAKIENKQKQILVKVTQFGGHDLSQEMNMAIGHSAQILIIMIKSQNQAFFHQCQNPFLVASEIWLKQMLRFKVTIFGAILKQEEGFFSLKNGTYCRIIYGPEQVLTQVGFRQKNMIEWKKSQFWLMKKHKIEYIEFEIYEKPLMKKERVMGRGRLYGNKVKKGKKQSIQLLSNQMIIGYLEISIE